RLAWQADDGDEVDYDRLRSGQEFWRASRREFCSGSPIVSVFFNIATPASREPEEILWRGAAALVLANLLEATGYRVELWAAQYCTRCSYEDGAGVFTAVCLKRSEQPLDLATLVNAVSGWFYRTLFFQAYYCR